LYSIYRQSQAEVFTFSGLFLRECLSYFTEFPYFAVFPIVRISEPPLAAGLSRLFN
jgi:hypothetical protein